MVSALTISLLLGLLMAPIIMPLSVIYLKKYKNLVDGKYKLFLIAIVFWVLIGISPPARDNNSGKIRQSEVDFAIKAEILLMGLILVTLSLIIFGGN